MKFNDDIIVIIGHNGATQDFDGSYYLFFGGYEDAEEFNGTIVTEEEVELAINHEVLHCLIDSIGEDASKLDNIWYQYTPSISILENCKQTGIGY